MCLLCLPPIFLTAFEQLCAGIHAKLDLLMLEDGALVSQTKRADNQLATSDVPIAKQLLAHLTSEVSTVSQERTDPCVQRVILGRADRVKVLMRMRSTVPPCPDSKASNSMSTARVLQAVLLYVRRAALRQSVSQLQEFSD